MLIADEFSTYAKLCKILWKYINSTAKEKFRGSTRNSVACGKLWALIISDGMQPYWTPMVTLKLS